MASLQKNTRKFLFRSSLGRNAKVALSEVEEKFLSDYTKDNVWLTFVAIYPTHLTSCNFFWQFFRPATHEGFMFQ